MAFSEESNANKCEKLLRKSEIYVCSNDRTCEPAESDVLLALKHLYYGLQFAWALLDLLLHLLPLYIQMLSVLWSEVIINTTPCG